MTKRGEERPITVYGAIIANSIIAAAKFAAALLTGSSALLSEGIHSTVDTGDQLLLLYGIHRSKKPADERHPFGHGPELYFWSVIVAVILFGVGGGMGVYEGITHLEHPTEISDPTWNYVVLAIAFVADFSSWTLAFRHLRAAQRKGESLWQTLRRSKDPAIFIVLGEDSADLLGIVIAFLGVFLSHRLHNPVFDGIASILVGLVLIVIAGFLAFESRSLIIGESADRDLLAGIGDIAAADPDIVKIQRPLTMHLGPSEILLALDAEFRPDLKADEVVRTINRLEDAISRTYPQVRHIFVEAEQLTNHKSALPSAVLIGTIEDRGSQDNGAGREAR
jgi:cation diffusion facilitator family transporter